MLLFIDKTQRPKYKKMKIEMKTQLHIFSPF